MSQNLITQNGGSYKPSGQCSGLLDLQRYRGGGDPNVLDLAPSNQDTDARYIDEETGQEWYWSIANEEWLQVTIASVLNPHAEMRWSATATTVFPNPAPIKIEGTTADEVVEGFIMPSDNRLQLTAEITDGRFLVQFIGLGESLAVVDSQYNLYIAKNGVAQSKTLVSCAATITDPRPTTLTSGIIFMSKDDYIEIWVQDLTATLAGFVQLTGIVTIVKAG